MTHWKLTLAYDGTPYHGWQVQPGLPAIQGTLSNAIHLAIRTEPLRLVPTETTATLTAEKAAAARTPIRTVTRSEWAFCDGLFVYSVTATGFLHHMVRNLVGTFVQCGTDRLNPDSIPA